MAQEYGPKIVTDGLVLCLDAADKNSYPGSGTTWSDLSGNGNDGTLSDAAIGTVSGSENIMAFDGTNDYVSVPTLDFSGDFTISCWIRLQAWTYPPSACGDDRASIFIQEDGYWNLITLQTINNSLYFRCFYEASGWFTLYYSGESLNTWMHACVSWDDSGLCKIYFNGQPGATQDVSSISINPTSSFSINKYAKHCGNAYVNGDMAYMNIYNKALSAAEITQNFNAQRSRFSI